MRVWTDQRQTFWLCFQLSSGLSEGVADLGERTAAGLLRLETIIFFNIFIFYKNILLKKLVKKKNKRGIINRVVAPA